MPADHRDSMDPTGGGAQPPISAIPQGLACCGGCAYAIIAIGVITASGRPGGRLSMVIDATSPGS
jgi:hypothetical protein